MDLLLILTYVSICYIVFKVFKVPVNQWTVTTAALIGFVLIVGLMIIMAYCHPYSVAGRQYFRSVPIVSEVKGLVTKVHVKTNTKLSKGDIIYEIENQRFKARVEQLKSELEYNKRRLDEAEKLYKQDAGRLYEVQKYQLKYDQLKAALEIAELDLEGTIVRAPSDGMVSQLAVQEGMMSVTMPFSPLVTFIPDEGRVYGAAFRQVAIGSIEPGFEAEFAFNALPGKIFQGKVLHILPAIAEGEFSGAGKLKQAKTFKDEGRYAVTFTLGEDIEKYNLPAGSAMKVAIYSHKVEPAAMVRKILLRMVSWQHYFNFEMH